MLREFTYAEAGVNRKLRSESKRALRIFRKTFGFSCYGRVVELPYGNIFPVGENCFLDFVIEGVGTKVLVAQLAGKFDTIGIDGVAMAVNDVVRSGAKPLAVADNIHVQISDSNLIRELVKGIARGAVEAVCVVPGGEIGDVADVMKGLVEGKGFDLVVAAVGLVSGEGIIYGRGIKAGDVVVGLRSSGIHSNGISLARKVLFKVWGGRYEPYDVPEGLDREVVYEVLEPTRIYVKPLLRVAEEVKVKAAVHITGDAYLKFDRLTKFSKGIGFEFYNFKPQPIFELIQKTAREMGSKVSDEEMFKTFNMGWGFAVVVSKEDSDKAIDVLEKAGVHAERIGCIKELKGIKILYKGRKIILK
ncbi:MAG: phosphoribosylformylglycinamidine cyclo-ligase [Candidatus Bathyarchaeota archaeon]|nr:phosphoribosylformylglycinamidine cyclo-ligase [Candidatus Bathyarchaeota archaeon]MDI6805263.1 phosphoribosylformylglycinamidine cyclo-ligase [Candidatus Bathyarchaeia archaeon]